MTEMIYSFKILPDSNLVSVIRVIKTKWKLSFALIIHIIRRLGVYCLIYYGVIFSLFALDFLYLLY